jgi:hypothetical protein
MAEVERQRGRIEGTSDKGQLVNAPVVSLPKGDGAIRGIDEKLSVNPATGTSP